MLTLRGSQELAAVLAAVAVGAGADVSKTCSRLVSVSASFDGVMLGSDSYAGVATGVISVASSVSCSEAGSSMGAGSAAGVSMGSIGVASSACLHMC